MILSDLLLLFVVSGMGAGLAFYQIRTTIHRLERNVERLEDQIYELREARAKLTKGEKYETKTIAAAKPAPTFRPVVVESVGPPCDPPESGEPYR